MTEDEWNALTSAYKAMTEAQGPLQAEYLKRQNNPDFSGYIPENEMSSISPQYQDAMSNWLTYAEKYGIGKPPLIGSSETTSSSTGAYGTQNRQYTDLLSNSPVSFERREPTIPKINTRGYNVNPNVNMGQKQVIGQDPVTGRPLYGNVSTEQTTLQGGVSKEDADILYDAQGNLLQPTTEGAVDSSGKSFVFPEPIKAAYEIDNNAYGGRRKRNRYDHGGTHFSLTSENRPITEGSLTNQMLNHQFQDLEFANYSTNKHTLGLNTPLGNRPLDKTNWYPNLNASVSLNNRQTRHGRPGTPNSAGLDVGYQIGDWESKPGIEGDLNFELQNQKQLRNRNFTTDNRVNLGAQYVNNSLEPYIGGDFGLGYDFGNRRNPKGNIKGGLNVRMPFRNTKGVDLGYSSTGSHRVLGRDRGFDQIGSGAMNISPYLEGSYNIGDNLSLSGKAGYNLLGSQPSFEAGLKYNIGNKMKKNKKYSHGGPPPHPEDLDVVRNQSNKEVLSKQLTSLNNPNLIENTYVSEDTSDPYALFEKIRSASIQENAGNPSQLNTTFLTKAGVTPFNIRSEDYSGEITGSGEKQVYEEGNFNPYLSNNPFQGPTAGSAVPESIPTFPYGGQPQQQGGQGNEIMQQVAQALQQGAPPEEIMGQLVQMGMPEEQAQQIIGVVMQQVQGQGNVPQMGIGGTVNQGIDAGVDLFGGDSNSALWKGISGGVGAIVDAYTGDYAGAAGQAGQVVSAIGSTSKDEDVQKATNIVETGTGLIDTFSNLKKPEGEIINESTVNPSGMPDLTNQDFFNTGYSELGAETGQPAFNLGQDYKQLPAAYGGRRRRATGGVEPMYNEAYEEWNQSQIQDNIKDAETGDKVNQATEGVVGAIFPWFAAANMASDLGTSFLGAEEINPNTGKKEFVENEGTRGWGSEAANVIKPVHEKVIDEIASEDTNWGKVAGDVLLPGIMPFMENAGLKTAYGGPRNPYACGGSKPMLPYKRAMGGPREDNTNVYRGATHEQGGIPIGYDYGGKVNPNKIEVEGGEVSWINPNGGEEYIFSDRIEFKSGGRTKRKK